MKVLLINDFYFGGGAEEVFRKTKSILEKNGFEVRMYFGSKSAAKPASVLSYFYSFKRRDELFHVLNEFRPNVIHIHNYYHLLTGSIFNSIRRYKDINCVKVVFTAHDYYSISPSSHLLYFASGIPKNLPINNTFNNLLFKRIDNRGILYSFVKKIAWLIMYCLTKPLNQIDIIISPSEFLKDVFEINGVSKEIVCIRNPLNNENIILNKGSIVCDKLEKLRFVYFGRLSPEKGILDFIRMLKKINISIQLDIIGDGPSKIELETYISNNNLSNISLLGRIPNDLLLDKLKKYDISIIPSVGYENAPLTIPESARAGLAILCSDRGGIPEMCKACNVPFFLYSPNDYQTLFDAFSRLKKEVAVGLKINPIIEEFTADKYFNLIRKVYSY